LFQQFAQSVHLQFSADFDLVYHDIAMKSSFFDKNFTTKERIRTVTDFEVAGLAETLGVPIEALFAAEE